MLSKVESTGFLRQVLKIQESESENSNNRLEFLNTIIRAIYNTLPFQCVTLLAVPLEKRHRPTENEIKTSMLQGLGGLCYSLNLFTYHLLKSLGYDAYLNSSRVYSPRTTPIQDDHLVVLVKNLKIYDDLYLVDAGCGDPTFQAINLDFQTDSPVFHESFLRYKFTKDGRKIRRLHDPTSSALNPERSLIVSKPEDFKLFYDFQINPTKDMKDINTLMDVVYTEPGRTPFHNSLRAMKFLNNRLVLICNSKLALEAENGEIIVTKFESDDELMKAFRMYFPEFDESTVKSAIQNWRQG